MALSYGLNTTQFRTYADLKRAYPLAPDGVYALFPEGRSGPMVQTYCMTHEGEYYQAIWKQFFSHSIQPSTVSGLSEC